MEKSNGKIKSFTDLYAWQEGHKLVLMVYKETKNFPKDEIFGLINQMRRCVVSVTSNIAEGFARQTFKDKIHFYFIGRGSIVELQNQLLIARDVGYLSADKFSEIVEQTVKAHTILNGLIKSSKTFTA